MTIHEASAPRPPLEEPRLNRVQRRTCFSSAMGIAIDGFDLFVIGAVIGLIASDLNLSPIMTGWVASSSLFGSIIGAILFGRLTDRFGRRWIYLLDLIFFVTFSLASALAWDAWSLLVFRFLLGIAIGADYPITAALVSESVPTPVRGKATGRIIAAFPAGALLGVATAFVVVEVLGTQDAWRWVLGLGALPALSTVFFRARVPESPRWLSAHGREAEARDAAERLSGGPVRPEDLAVFQTTQPKGSFSNLFQAPLRKRTTLSVLPWFFFDIAVFPIGIFVPLVLALALHASPSVESLHFAQILFGAVVYNAIQLAGMLLATNLVERLGRMRLQLTGFALVALGLLTLALSQWVGSDFGLSVSLLVAGLALVAFFQGWPAVSTFMLAAELFPTPLRGTAHGLSSGAGKIGAAFAVFAFPPLIASTSLAFAICVGLAAAVAGYAVTATLRIETTGKSLEELND